MSRPFLFLILVLALGGAILEVMRRLPTLTGDPGLMMRYGAGMILIGGFALLLLSRSSTSKRALVPAAVLFILSLGLAPRLIHRLEGPNVASTNDRSETETAAGALITPLARSAGDTRPHIARIPADRSGHFFVEGRIGGRSVRFLVDTGATVVALSAADAQRVGLHTLPSDYTEEVRTAQGTTRAAPATLPEIEVGTVRVRNVSAQVLAPGLEVSLLGMSFLSRLGQFSVEDGVLNLRE